VSIATGLGPWAFGNWAWAWRLDQKPNSSFLSWPAQTVVYFTLVEKSTFNFLLSFSTARGLAAVFSFFSFLHLHGRALHGSARESIA
jgi:hypothetical protein